MTGQEKLENWTSVNLPENCPNICISFKKEIAEIQIKRFGAKPLYGFDSEKEDWLPVKIFITYGGTLAPNRDALDAEKISWLEFIGAKAFPEPIKYVYTFPGYAGAFNLSERYIKETPLEELKAQYDRNEKHVELCLQGEYDRKILT